MKNSWSNKTTEILKIGKPLFSVGINNWALTKSESLAAIEHFDFLHIPIFGGDVYESIDGVLRPNYDNWYCEPLSEEIENDFFNRSIIKEKNYINSYQAKESDMIFFVLVPKN